MAIHQLVPNFVPGDATGQAALHFQWLLRRLGHAGELYSGEIAPELSPLVRPVSALAPRPEDWVFYHHGIGSALSGHWMHLPCHRGIVFHNITPARFFQRGSALEEALLSGRAQLSALASRSELTLGVSDYNSRELRAAGHRNVHTVPLFIEPARFTLNQADPEFLRQWKSQGQPTLLSVGRVTSHKRIEDVLSLHRELRQLVPQSRLWVVGGYADGSRYFRMLSRMAEEIGNVTFLGKLTHAQLVAAYRLSTVFVSMSEHEGFGVPLMEAMASDLPVMAFAAAAVPETLGGGGVAFTEKRFALLAELGRELHESTALRASVLKGQARRLRSLSAAASEEALARALRSAVRPRPALRASSAKRRIGIIVQRFGPASGGAERHAREVALRLSEQWNVTVLTSTAEDHLTWQNVHPEGISRDGPLTVQRFATAFPRQTRSLNALSRKIFREPVDRLTEEVWLSLQGPEMPGLLRHLDEAKHRYDAWLAFTYLYSPTARAVSMLGPRCAVVPTAHDEPPLRFGVYHDVFTRPSRLLCNTEEEAALIRRQWPNAAPVTIAGAGVEPPASVDPHRFRQDLGISAPYLFYVGRIEHEKGIPDLLHHHRKLRRVLKDAAPELVLAGDSRLRWLQGPGVRYIGRVTDMQKWDGLAGALATVVPAALESLSLLTLESFSVGTPVLANGRSEVLAGHVRRSRAGAVFTGAESYAQGLAHIRENREEMATKARRYATRYRWDNVMATYRNALEAIIEASGTFAAAR